MPYTIALARADELPLLPHIETAATTLFEGIEAVMSLPLINSELAEFEHAHAAGLLWVARSEDGRPVGFALCERLGQDIHLEELDVHPMHGRQGLGRALVLEVCRHAAAQGRDVTLTTFREVPWNQPFYETLGFREIAPADVTPELAARIAEETAAGLPPQMRTVMRRPQG
ncbi:MAG TPA: GNAT family N-acetyltransferase [Candidatus Binatia bacterium]|nr:GNAT family N-acetyltransferase [Candidatus Binatia bacterium]